MKVRLSPVSPIVRLTLDFNFGERTVVGVGEPVPKGPNPKIPVWARDDLKLRLMLPLNMETPKFLDTTLLSYANLTKRECQF